MCWEDYCAKYGLGSWVLVFIRVRVYLINFIVVLILRQRPQHQMCMLCVYGPTAIESILMIWSSIPHAPHRLSKDHLSNTDFDLRKAY